MYTLQAAWCSAPLSISHSEFSVPFASYWSNFSGMKVSSNSTYVELWLVFLVNESVCSFQACPSTTLLSSTIVQNTWLASEHTIYSKKIGRASWSVLADCLWSWYARYSFHHCYLYYLTFLQIADTTGTKVSVSLLTPNMHLCWLDHQKTIVGMQMFCFQTQLPMLFLLCSTL